MNKVDESQKNIQKIDATAKQLSTTKRPAFIVKHLITSVECFIERLKQVPFLGNVLTVQDGDCGVSKLLKDFQELMFCNMLDQFYCGDIDSFTKLNHRQILDKVLLYILNRIEKSLFKLQTERDEQFTIRAFNLQWVTPERFGL